MYNAINQARRILRYLSQTVSSWIVRPRAVYPWMLRLGDIQAGTCRVSSLWHWPVRCWKSRWFRVRLASWQFSTMSITRELLIWLYLLVMSVVDNQSGLG